MMEPADFGEYDDLSAPSVVDSPPFGRILLERQMGASAIVVACVVRKNPAQMALMENDDGVEALSTRRLNHFCCLDPKAS